MTKQEFKDTVKNKIFSVRWLKNDGTEGYIHRGFLGLNKNIGSFLEHKEHDDYVLVYKMGNGYGTKRRWGNVNPNTITHINNTEVAV